VAEQLPGGAVASLGATDDGITYPNQNYDKQLYRRSARRAITAWLDQQLRGDLHPVHDPRYAPLECEDVLVAGRSRPGSVDDENTRRARVTVHTLQTALLSAVPNLPSQSAPTESPVTTPWCASGRRGRTTNAEHHRRMALRHRAPDSFPHVGGDSYEARLPALHGRCDGRAAPQRTSMATAR
jgi:hypothetical protein